jgi:hypothetical protein
MRRGIVFQRHVGAFGYNLAYALLYFGWIRLGIAFSQKAYLIARFLRFFNDTIPADPSYGIGQRETPC